MAKHFNKKMHMVDFLGFGRIGNGKGTPSNGFEKTKLTYVFG
jgi:hypothetical protein